MIYLVAGLGILSGTGLGFFLGQVWILYKQKNGYIMPINPYSLPIMGTDDPNIRTVMTKKGARIVKGPTEEGAVSTIKNPKRTDPLEEAPKYI